MAKTWILSIFLTIFFFVVPSLGCDTNDTTTIRGMFIFGDDTVDPGNNNGLLTFFMKANFLPYGVDFPDGPSGRFTNGKTVVDCIADKLELPYAPPFPDANHEGTNIIQGVNFASTGTGIFGVTGIGILGIQHMDEQISRFKDKILPKLKEALNCRGQTILSQYLFVISSGNNDYSSWWILKQYLVVNPHVMAGMLVDQMQAYIKELYELGARKFLLISAYPIGCGPGIVKEKASCEEYVNNATDIYHEHLLTMVEHVIQTDTPDALISVLNSANIIKDIYIGKRSDSGINVVDCPCCQTNIGDICEKAGKTCLNREQYLYYDGFHLTEAANCYLGKIALTSTKKLYIAPSNVNKIIKTPINLNLSDPAPSPPSRTNPN